MSQCLIIMAKRLRDYIPVMLYIMRRSELMCLDFSEELHRFADANTDVGSRIAELDKFLADLEYSGQKLEDWDFDLVTMPPPKSPNWAEAMAEASASLRKQAELKKAYKQFAGA